MCKTHVGFLRYYIDEQPESYFMYQPTLNYLALSKIKYRKDINDMLKNNKQVGQVTLTLNIKRIKKKASLYIYKKIFSIPTTVIFMLRLTNFTFLVFQMFFFMD